MLDVSLLEAEMKETESNEHKKQKVKKCENKTSKR